MATASNLPLQEPTFKWKNHLYHYPHSLDRHSIANLRIGIKRSKTLGSKCYLPYNNDAAHHPNINKQIGFFVNVGTKKNHFEFVAKSFINALKALKKPAAAAVLLGLLLMHDPNSALAAGSGGRMGGNSFSSRSSMSSSSFRSYDAPRSSTVYYSPSDGVYDDPEVGFGSSTFLIVIAVVAFMLISVLTATEKTSVLKLQVGLLGLGRSVQKDLNRIAETADTSTSEGLHYVLTGTVLALLRHPDYCISAYSSVDIKKSMEGGEKRFNQLSIEERGKFDEETLVNVNNVKKRTMRLRASGVSNEFIVITILVAAGGEHKLPSISNSIDLREALQKLASIPSSGVLAVEVLWTPQNEDDNLSEQELMEDYPLLQPL